MARRSDSRIVFVDGNIEKAVKELKQRMILAGDFRDWKRRRYHVKPGDRVREDRERGIARTRKRLLKRFETLGY